MFCVEYVGKLWICCCRCLRCCFLFLSYRSFSFSFARSLCMWYCCWCCCCFCCHCCRCCCFSCSSLLNWFCTCVLAYVMHEYDVFVLQYLAPLSLPLSVIHSFIHSISFSLAHSPIYALHSICHIHLTLLLPLSFTLLIHICVCVWLLAVSLCVSFSFSHSLS